MSQWYYDCLFEAHPHLENVVRVGRVYCFKFDDFSHEDWEKLTDSYSQLPGWIGTGITPLTQLLPYWFGQEVSDDDWMADNYKENDDLLIYLTASVERTGLQIDGTVDLEDWLRWTGEFEKRNSLLPHYIP